MRRPLLIRRASAQTWATLTAVTRGDFPWRSRSSSFSLQPSSRGAVSSATVFVTGANSSSTPVISLQAPAASSALENGEHPAPSCARRVPPGRCASP